MSKKALSKLTVIKDQMQRKNGSKETAFSLQFLFENVYLEAAACQKAQ